MSNLISRKATIDKINERQRELIYCFGFENDAVKIMDIAKSIVIAMPSAQPVIRCKDCKHSFLHDNGEKISRICGLTRMCGTTPDDWFCADAERREE